MGSDALGCQKLGSGRVQDQVSLPWVRVSLPRVQVGFGYYLSGFGFFRVFKKWKNMPQIWTLKQYFSTFVKKISSQKLVAKFDNFLR